MTEEQKRKVAEIRARYNAERDEAQREFDELTEKFREDLMRLEQEFHESITNLLSEEKPSEEA